MIPLIAFGCSGFDLEPVWGFFFFRCHLVLLSLFLSFFFLFSFPLLSISLLGRSMVWVFVAYTVYIVGDI